MTRLLLATAATLLAAPAFAQSVFLDDATVFDTDGNRSVMDIQLVDGRIAAMEAELAAADGSEMLTGTFVSPGLVSAVSTLGIVDIGGESDTNDTSAETELFSVSIRAADSFNPREVHLANARRRGVMHAVVTPSPDGHTIFGGTGMVAALDGTVLNDTAHIHLALGEAGASFAGGSRGAAMAQFRGALDDAGRAFQSDYDGDVLTRLDARALRPALSGSVPLMISASRASDLQAIAGLKGDYPALDIIIVGAEEAHLVADDLVAAGIRLVVDPLENLPDSFDSVNASLDNILALEEAGADYAIAPLSALGTVKDGILHQHAGNAMGHGLSEASAMRAVTSTPAGWYGIELGDMAVGEAASIVVWDGHPLETMSAPVAMYKDGVVLSLESRMTALRDRYNPTTDDDRPYKYR